MYICLGLQVTCYFEANIFYDNMSIEIISAGMGCKIRIRMTFEQSTPSEILERFCCTTVFVLTVAIVIKLEQVRVRKDKKIF